MRLISLIEEIAGKLNSGSAAFVYRTTIKKSPRKAHREVNVLKEIEIKEKPDKEG